MDEIAKEYDVVVLGTGTAALPVLSPRTVARRPPLARRPLLGVVQAFAAFCPSPHAPQASAQRREPQFPPLRDGFFFMAQMRIFFNLGHISLIPLFPCRPNRVHSLWVCCASDSHRQSPPAFSIDHHKCLLLTPQFPAVFSVSKAKRFCILTRTTTTAGMFRLFHAVPPALYALAGIR